MIEILAVATITVLAVVSPGADFAMVTRNSLLQGRSSGLLALWALPPAFKYT